MAAIVNNDKLAEAEELCSDLYRIRDTFSTCCWRKRGNDWKPPSGNIQISEATENSEGLKGERKTKATYLKGKAKGVFQDYNESAEKDLSKAVELDQKTLTPGIVWRVLLEKTRF